MANTIIILTKNFDAFNIEVVSVAFIKNSIVIFWKMKICIRTKSMNMTSFIITIAIIMNTIKYIIFFSSSRFSGFENQTNLAERVLAMFEGNPSMVSIDTLKRLRFPYGTPFESENYLALNFDAHGISNTVMRIKSALVSQGDTNAVDVCDEILSGARKELLLDMKAAGAL